MEKPTLEDWNWHILMLNQAMIGAISHNFRMVSLKWTEDCWLIEVVLEEMLKQDVEEANDISDELSIFLEDVKDRISPVSMKRIETKIFATNESLSMTSEENVRVVFWRREHP